MVFPGALDRADPPGQAAAGSFSPAALDVSLEVTLIEKHKVVVL
jgi:hypothetical protein